MFGDDVVSSNAESCYVVAIGSHFPVGVGLGVDVVGGMVRVLLPSIVGLGIVGSLVGVMLRVRVGELLVLVSAWILSRVMLRVFVVVSWGVIVTVPSAAALDLEPIESHASLESPRLS